MPKTIIRKISREDLKTIKENLAHGDQQKVAGEFEVHKSFISAMLNPNRIGGSHEIIYRLRQIALENLYTEIENKKQAVAALEAIETH